ncbi:hypothetical protein [Arenimonas sp. MALMAid1274]|uniref:hypothetical protein n=1 Tax=Arenimonas sp. MALMAid1274 TaxID=3411630 RepID=UPI003BA29B34
MYLAKRFALLVLAGVFLLVAAFGVFRFLVEAGHSPLRYVVQDAAVFAAGVMGMFLCWRTGRGLVTRHEAALEQGRRFTGDVLEASMSPWKQVLGIFVFVLMAAVSGLMYLDDRDWRLALCAIFFALLSALLIPYCILLYRPGRPTLRMDAAGFDHALYGWVPWQEVHGIYLDIQTIRNHELKRLVLGVSNPGRYRSRMPWVARLLSEQPFKSDGRFGTLSIGLQGLGMDPLRVFNAAQVLRDRASPPRLKHWHPSFDHHTIAVALELDYLAENPDRLPPEEIGRRLDAIAPHMPGLADRR